jgi:hypothetical protein
VEDRSGVDWWLPASNGVRVRIAKEGEPEEFPEYAPDLLQRVMDKAAAQFFDPYRPVTPPVPTLAPPPLPQNSRSRRRR